MDGMDSQHGRIVRNGSVSFNSNAKAPFNIMSNFHGCVITLGGVTYPSAEHAFQAQLVTPDFRHFFSTTGPLATLRSGFKTLMPKATDTFIERKALYWGKKNNIGVVAKMASKRDYLYNIHGVRKMDVGFDECRIIFKTVLVAKLDAFQDFRELLYETGSKYLFEFSRDAERRSLTGTTIRWGAMIVDNKVIGHNQMGALMMWLRKEFVL